MINKTVLAITMAISPLTTFALQGGAGPGGGDPSHVQAQANQQSSKFAEAMITAENDQKADEAKRANHLETGKARNALDVYASRAHLYLRLFQMVDYPFSPEFKKNIDYDKVYEILNLISDRNPDEFEKNFSIDNSLGLNEKPITFLSAPDLNHPKNGKLAMNTTLFYQQEKSLKPWSLVATVFHEVLRLQNMEGSDSYPFTKEFAVALRDAYENPSFFVAMKRSIFEGCRRGIANYEYLAIFDGLVLTRNVFSSIEQPDIKFLNNLTKEIRHCGGTAYGPVDNQ